MAAAELPNTQAWSRLPDIFAAIKAAGTPPKFNNEFLKSTLGFTSSNDRSVIAILRKLGFIGSSGEPTQRCNNFKGHGGGRGESASRSCVLDRSPLAETSGSRGITVTDRPSAALNTASAAASMACSTFHIKRLSGQRLLSGDHGLASTCLSSPVPKTAVRGPQRQE